MIDTVRIGDNHGHATSRDYEKLFELMQEHPIICVLNDSCRMPDPVRDIAATLYTGGSWQVSVRGGGYVLAWDRDTFIRQCEKYDLEWLVPPEKRYTCPHCMGKAEKRGDEVVCLGEHGGCVFYGDEDEFLVEK